MTKPKHGGKREGAGRKPLPIPKEPVAIKVAHDVKRKLNFVCKSTRLSQAKNISAWVEVAYLHELAVQSTITRLAVEAREKSTNK